MDYDQTDYSGMDTFGLVLILGITGPIFLMMLFGR